jgi:hypothetical protein
MVAYPLPVALDISDNLLDRPHGAESTIWIILGAGDCSALTVRALLAVRFADLLFHFRWRGRRNPYHPGDVSTPVVCLVY